MRIAIHQPNFIPHFPFFQKMAQSDKFVIMINCQYEKDGWQNRTKVNDKWWTNPVQKGEIPIRDKKYIEGSSLVNTNMKWIEAIAGTLNITTPLVYDFDTEKKGTARIIEICKSYKADEYLANSEAFEKYLNKEELTQAGIEFLPFKSNYKKHTFDMFAEYGIEKTRKLLYE